MKPLTESQTKRLERLLELHYELMIRPYESSGRRYKSITIQNLIDLCPEIAEAIREETEINLPTDEDVKTWFCESHNSKTGLNHGCWDNKQVYNEILKALKHFMHPESVLQGEIPEDKLREELIKFNNEMCRFHDQIPIDLKISWNTLLAKFINERKENKPWQNSDV